MKRILFLISISLLIGLFLFVQLKKTAESENQSHSKKYKTVSEMKAETIAFKTERRAKGWAKPDKPSEFVLYHQAIRTKKGDKSPKYQSNYKLIELEKAQSRKFILKSTSEKLNWKERGPGNVSGRTRGLIIDPSDTKGGTWYAGSVGGGIWKTENAGVSWTNLTPNLPNLAIASLAMAASNNNTIYAGTGEGFYNSDAITGDGILKSTDKGKTWKQLASTSDNEDFSYVNRIIVDPADENIILAATNTSIQKSIDGGTTWKSVFDDSKRIQHIIAHPNDFKILYASAYFGGVLKSSDKGNTWKYVFESNEGRIELAIAPSKPEVIYALDESSQLYVSTNSGADWSPSMIDAGVKDQFLGAQGWYDNAIAVSPDDPNLLTIGGVNLYKVEVTGTSATPTSFVKVSEVDTKSFMAYINHGGDYLGGGMEVNLEKKNYTTIEVQFGPGKKQLAHRFKVPAGKTSGVPAAEYTYLDYVEVPFQVWDIENNRQLMVSFRDQDLNGVFNLTKHDDAAFIGREYIWINDQTYSNTANSKIAVTGGHEFSEIAFWWPVLADGATWDATKLPESKIVISRSSVYVKNLRSNKIADWAGQGAPYVHADFHNIQYTKTRLGTRLIVANDGGVAYTDGTNNVWTNLSNGYNSSQFYGVDKHPTLDRYIGGLQDNGSWFSPENPDHMSQWVEASGGDGFDAVWHASDPNKMLTTVYNNSIYLSFDGGKSFGETAGFDDTGSGNAPFLTQVGYTPVSPDKVYVIGISGVTYSEDFGQSWTLSAIADSTWGWTGRGFVEPSPVNPSVVWAVSQLSDEGSIHVSTDGGKTFKPTAKFNEDMGTASGLATHPLNDSIAYVLFSYSDFAKILRTQNMGQSWEDISNFEETESTNGFPDVAVYSLLVMPHNPEIIWVGTEIGLFISNDNGKNWEFADNGLPATAIWELKIRGIQVIAATHGRGIWSVDIPEIATAARAPMLITAGTNPSNQPFAQVNYGALYDSITYIIDNKTELKFKANASHSKVESISLNVELKEGEHTLKILAYKGINVFSSVQKTFSIIKFNKAQKSYTNNFNTTSNDFVGEGFTVMEMSALGEGMAIHTKHPYPDKSTLFYYLKTPIIVDENSDNQATFLKYRDIPMLEEGEKGSLFGTADFYDYVVTEGSKDGINWIPLLDGYDFATIKDKARDMGISIKDDPSPELFINHTINLANKFAKNDTILIRFKLFSDANSNGWGWVIDDVDIQLSLKVKAYQPFASKYKVYPIPCNNQLNIDFSDEQEQMQLTIYDLQGRKIEEIQMSNQQRVQINTSNLIPSIYLLEIKSGNKIEKKRFQVYR